jgi:hypothetical protein
MSLKSWLLKKLSGDDTAILELSPEEKELSGLNLHEVLGAHMEWKKKLKNTLNGTDTEQYEASLVSQDNLCVLGKWLYGPGKKLYSHLTEYETLKKIHTDFHLCAGEVLTAHDKGDTKLAEQILKGQFSDNSNQIQLDLVQLFSSVKNS